MTRNNTLTDRYAVIGHPVQHSRSPLIHGLFARQTGENMTYELLDAAPADFASAVQAFSAANGKGLNVTVPHKQAAFDLSTEHSPAATLAAAVNTLSFLPNGTIRGDNTDGVGFIRDLTINHRQGISDRRVLIIGAGGATRGILAPLLEAKPAELVLANRTPERALALVERFPYPGSFTACGLEDIPSDSEFDLIVNATSAGVRGETLPLPPGCVSEKTFCYDMAYGTDGTPFVDWAVQNHAREAVQGWGMLVEQAAESFYIWRDVRPDTVAVLARITT